VVRFPDLADFLVSADGRQVTSHPAPDADEDAVAHMWRNQVRPLALAQQGRCVFHASAVALDGESAVAFLGPSGRGKSTLAAALALRGYPYLTDDVLELDPEGAAWYVHPSAPSLRLWEDARHELLRPAHAHAHSVQRRKADVVAHHAIPACTQRRRLRAAFILADGTGQPTCDRLPASESVVAWLSNGFTLETIEPGALRDQFDRICRLASSIPTLRLGYQRRWDGLDRLIEHVVATARQL
jgi:hypothetical protein